MTETLPFDLPGYHIQGLAGRGGMGLVYRAEQVTTHRLVAIKLLTAGSVDPGRLATFRREAATLAQLEHPHIVPLYDYGEHDGVPYLVVRFLNGGTVAERLRAGPIALDSVVRWVTDVADALDAAHRRGITHRDVKPSNLLLDEAGNVYLGDFGIAATAVDLASAPHAGSAAYASPEQARGESPDFRSDVYSLAVTAFEMVTGKRPYEAETALGMMVRHMHDPVPSARAVAPSLSPAVDAAIAAGMAKDPRARPTSAGAFARSLREAASRPPAAGEEVAPTAVVTRPARGPSRWLIVGGVLAVGAACLVGVSLLGGGLAAWFSSPTAVPTAVKPQPTAPLLASPSPSGKSIPFADDFSDPASGFAVSQAADGQIAYVDGTLQINVPAGVELYSPYRGVDEQDLVVSVQADLRSGPPKSEMGVICRWKDEGNFVAGVLRADGMVSLWRKVGGVVERWIDWKPIAGVTGGSQASHTLQLTCQGAQVRLAVDGQEVAAADDPAPAPGTLALLAGLLEPGQATVAFDNLAVSIP
jgi:serine/threonine protein kinase